MKQLLLALIALAFASLTAGCTSTTVDPGPSISGTPCPTGTGTCFKGGNYPAAYLAEGGLPDKGSSGGADGSGAK